MSRLQTWAASAPRRYFADPRGTEESGRLAKVKSKAVLVRYSQNMTWQIFRLPHGGNYLTV